MAAKGVVCPTEATDIQRAGSLKLAECSQPFFLENVKALSYLCGTFLFRWGNNGWRQRSYSMRLLNTLAFYHVEVAESGASVQNVSLVRMLWCVLQDTERFEDFIKVRLYASILFTAKKVVNNCGRIWICCMLEVQIRMCACWRYFSCATNIFWLS